MTLADRVRLRVFRTWYVVRHPRWAFSDTLALAKAYHGALIVVTERNLGRHLSFQESMDLLSRFSEWAVEENLDLTTDSVRHVNRFVTLEAIR